MSNDSNVLFRVNNLKKWFPVRGGLLGGLIGKAVYCKAVDGVTFDINKGEVICLVGESGSGKTTAARLLLRLEKPTAGEILYFPENGESDVDFTKQRLGKLRKYRKHLQMIFQNPYESLDPRMTIFDILSEPLHINKICKREEIAPRVITALEEVGLIPPEEFLIRFPHELSGGQRQRICIARTLVLDPTFNVADEPASMLDASTRIEILNLLQDLNSKHNMAILFITHDLAQARYLGHKINVMYLGRIVESGDVELVIKEPHHPYTKVLVSNIPVPDPEAKRERLEIEGEIPTAINLPPGCRFSPRCPFAFDKCREEEPELMEKKGRLSACWLD
jgi:peptide/nickel transport system ATP-binding protein